MVAVGWLVLAILVLMLCVKQCGLTALLELYAATG